MKNIFLFIAGAKALRIEREKIKSLVNDMNAEYLRLNRDIVFSAASYENYGDRQEEYNSYIQSCDMIFFVIDDRIGAKTEQELELAINTYNKNDKKKPQIYILMRTFNERTPDIEHLENLLSSYAERGLYDNYYIEFSNLEDMVLKVKDRMRFYAERSLHNTQNSDNQINPLLKDIAQAINKCYYSGFKVFSNFPDISNDQIREIMDKPVKGVLKESVDEFADNLTNFANAIDSIIENNVTLDNFSNALNTIDSRCRELYPDEKFIKISNLPVLSMLLNTIAEQVRASDMSRIITAKLATNVARGKEYNNQGVRTYMYIGNYILNIIDNTTVNNLGAAIIHDLYVALPEEYRKYITTDLQVAITDADNIGGLYSISLG